MITLLLAQAAAVAGPDKPVNFWENLLIYLGLAAVTYIALILLGRILKQRLGLPLGWFYHMFAFAAALFLPALNPRFEYPSYERHIDAAVIMTATFVGISFLRHYLMGMADTNDPSKSMPKFLSQISSIGIVLLALGFVVQFIYKEEVPGLLAGAGVVGLVLGLALQDTLGNIFSGMAIYFGGQFKAGDWLQVGDHHAEIMEINWRSTRLRTDDNVFLDIPNSNITKETVINFTHPTTLHALRLSIGLDYNTTPTVIKSVLIEATRNVTHVRREPAPTVFLKEFADSSVIYEIKFWIDEHRHFEEIMSSIRTNLWYALRRHNISIPYPIQAQFDMDPPTECDDSEKIQGAISKVSFAAYLRKEQMEHLLREVKCHHFGKGEHLICQGDEGSSMYVLMEGAAEVFVKLGDVTRSVAHIGAGDCIGEMSLLTGECRSATIVAVEDIHAVEITKETLSPIIEQSPELLETLSDLLAQRRLQNEGVLHRAEGDLAAQKQDYRSNFLSKLKSFFSI